MIQACEIKEYLMHTSTNNTYYYFYWRARLGAATISNLLENATALGSRIPPHAVLLHVNNTPVKLKIIFAI